MTGQARSRNSRLGARPNLNGCICGKGVVFNWEVMKRREYVVDSPTQPKFSKNLGLTGNENQASINFSNSKPVSGVVRRELKCHSGGAERE
jgi:hypothetical protein